MAEEVHANQEILRTCLCAAVPLWMERYSSWPLAELQSEGERLGDQVAWDGGGHDGRARRTTKRQREENRNLTEKYGTAAAFNAVARGLGVLAHWPGGVTFLGLHWCAARRHYGVEGMPHCRPEILRTFE
jgi:hypothetical protein